MSNLIAFPNKEDREAMHILKEYAKYSPPLNARPITRDINPTVLKERQHRRAINFAFNYGQKHD